MNHIDDEPRSVQDGRGKIRVWPSRHLVDPWDLKVLEVNLRDLAHHLSLINRFTGGTPWPYSVAQHSVMGAWLIPISQPLLRKAMLLHDGSEAYLNDMASPVKRNAGMREYCEASDRAQRVIFEAFDLPWELMAQIKWADAEIFRREQETWNGTRYPRDAIIPWQAAAAEHFFLEEFRHIEIALSRTQLGHTDALA